MSGPPQKRLRDDSSDDEYVYDGPLQLKVVLPRSDPASLALQWLAGETLLAADQAAKVHRSDTAAPLPRVNAFDAAVPVAHRVSFGADRRTAAEKLEN
jgi:hypothetical protein